MSDCATGRILFETPTPLALEATFDGGRLTSDGGLVWLSKMDSEMGLCEAISECVPEWRNRRGRHPLRSLVHQRVFQIACVYEDQNDSDTLREDPLLKALCGSLPESGRELASQPTISRMENAATMRSCHEIARLLFELYLSQREKNGAPERVLLDFATQEHRRTDKKATLFGEDLYGAASWEKKRRVVYKAEAMEQGINRRFVVSTRGGAPEELYEFYAKRGEAENWIKDFKLNMRADRLSCHRFVANQARC